MISNYLLFETHYSEGDEITVKKGTMDMDGKEIPEGEYTVVEPWEEFYLIKDKDNNRYKLPDVHE